MNDWKIKGKPALLILHMQYSICVYSVYMRAAAEAAARASASVTRRPVSSSA